MEKNSNPQMKPTRTAKRVHPNIIKRYVAGMSLEQKVHDPNFQNILKDKV